VGVGGGGWGGGVGGGWVGGGRLNSLACEIFWCTSTTPPSSFFSFVEHLPHARVIRLLPAPISCHSMSRRRVVEILLAFKCVRAS